MLSWGQLEERWPELAQAGKGLLYQFGVGLAFLSTTRRDGGPRVHPMCHIIVDDLLVALIVPGPKLHDLIRDGRYAMHSFQPSRMKMLSTSPERQMSCTSLICDGEWKSSSFTSAA